jgi:hypothetical protein
MGGREKESERLRRVGPLSRRRAENALAKERSEVAAFSCILTLEGANRKVRTKFFPRNGKRKKATLDSSEEERERR